MDTAFDFESGLTSKRHFSLFQQEFKPIETTSRALVVVFASVKLHTGLKEVANSIWDSSTVKDVLTGHAKILTYFSFSPVKKDPSYHLNTGRRICILLRPR